MKVFRFLIVGVLLSILIGACAPTPAPSIDPKSLVATIAAATINAMPTNTPYPTATANQPGDAATNTITPTETPISTIPALPTPTIDLTLPAPGALVPGNGIGSPFIYYTATPIPYNCNLEIAVPIWGTVFRPRVEFRMRWKIRNTGAAIWKSGDIILVHVSGDRIEKSKEKDESPLLFAIYPDEKINIYMRMIAPKQPGSYTATWGLQRFNKKDTFCTFSMSIRVEPKPPTLVPTKKP